MVLQLKKKKTKPLDLILQSLYEHRFMLTLVFALGGVLVVSPGAAFAREKLKKVGEATIHTWSREKDGNFRGEILNNALKNIEEIVAKEVLRQSKEQVANTDLLSSMVQLANASKSAAPGLVVPVFLPVKDKFLGFGFAPSFSSRTFGLRSKVAQRVVQTTGEQQQKLIVETIKPLLEEQMRTMKFLTVLNITGGFINPMAVEAAKQGVNSLRRFFKKRYRNAKKAQNQKNLDTSEELNNRPKTKLFTLDLPTNQILQVLKQNPVIMFLALIFSTKTEKGKAVIQKLWKEVNALGNPSSKVPLTKKSLLEQTFSYVRSHPILILCVILFCALSVTLFSLILKSEGKTITEKFFYFASVQKERTANLFKTAVDKFLGRKNKRVNPFETYDKKEPTKLSFEEQQFILYLLNHPDAAF
jgi:hypothetical protein